MCSRCWPHPPPIPAANARCRLATRTAPALNAGMFAVEIDASGASRSVSLLADAKDFSGVGDISRAMAEAGSAAADNAPSGTPVDFVSVVRGEPGISEYFIGNVEPFHRCTWGAAIRRFLGRSKA